MEKMSELSFLHQPTEKRMDVKMAPNFLSSVPSAPDFVDFSRDRKARTEFLSAIIMAEETQEMRSNALAPISGEIISKTPPSRKFSDEGLQFKLSVDIYGTEDAMDEMLGTGCFDILEEPKNEKESASFFKRAQKFMFFGALWGLVFGLGFGLLIK